MKLTLTIILLMLLATLTFAEEVKDQQVCFDIAASCGDSCSSDQDCWTCVVIKAHDLDVNCKDLQELIEQPFKEVK